MKKIINVKNIMKAVKKLWKVLKFSFKHRKLVFSLMLAICFVSAYNGIIKENKEMKTMQEAQREELRKGVSLQENILSNTEALRDRLTPDNNMVNANEVNNVINNTREKIKMLYERLEKAKAI